MALRPDSSQSRSQQLAAQGASPSGDAFLREVDDALREDKVFTALQRYGKPVAALIFAGLLGLAGWLWYENHTKATAGQQGEELTKAIDLLEARNLGGAATGLAPIAKDGHDAYRGTAKLVEAGILSEQGKTDQAAAAFAAIAADTDTPKVYRDLAAIREVAITFDKIGPDQVVARLKPLAVPGNAWFANAGELVGVAYLKQGKNDLAGALFGQIAKDKSAPDSLRRRARQMAGLLGVDAVEDPGETALAAPAAQ